MSDPVYVPTSQSNLVCVHLSLIEWLFIIIYSELYHELQCLLFIIINKKFRVNLLLSEWEFFYMFNLFIFCMWSGVDISNK